MLPPLDLDRAATEGAAEAPNARCGRRKLKNVPNEIINAIDGWELFFRKKRFACSRAKRTSQSSRKSGRMLLSPSSSLKVSSISPCSLSLTELFSVDQSISLKNGKPRIVQRTIYLRSQSLLLVSLIVQCWTSSSQKFQNFFLQSLNHRSVHQIVTKYP